MSTAPARRIVVFPGQFDPITRGHLDIIQRGAALFDELVIGVGVNPDKRELFAADERVELIHEVIGSVPKVRVEKYSGLTIDFAKRIGASAMLRGIRDVADLRYEFQLALANRAVGGIETVFIMTGDQHALTSSSLIRQVVTLGADARQLLPLVPEPVVSRLLRLQSRLRGENPNDTPLG
jgi:pantetheine-phosphate adenylyltransferase